MRAQIVQEHLEAMRIDWFAQIVIGSKFYGFDGVFNLSLPRDDDGWNLPAVAAHFAEHGQPVFFWQPQIEQEDLRVRAFNQLQSALAILRSVNAISPGRD